jgi:glycosyltransferase involved in cell wall biosynthesis
MNVLYLSYDGLTDPLGGSQILPYLVGLSGRGHCISLISFEKAVCSSNARQRVERQCAEAGIKWYPMRYHRRPPILSTVRDVAAMRRRAFKLHRATGFDLVHCRSYVPALAGLALKRRGGVGFIFDMRGFWPEERVEGGAWNLRNPLYRTVFTFFKRKERSFFGEADAIVSLTETAREDMLARSNSERPKADPAVIPCCVDMEHFQPVNPEQRMAARALLRISANAKVLCYLGSLGGNYQLEKMLRFFRAYRDRWPGARFLFVTREAPETIVAAAENQGLDLDELIIRAADREEVPALIAAADHGIAFKVASMAQKACSPTKIGEMMAMGIPVVANAGVGDVDKVIADTGAGVIVDNFARDGDLAIAVERLAALGLTAAEIRSGCRRWFDLEQGISAYDHIYRSMAGGRQTA